MMDEKTKEGIRSEFNMSLESLRRVHTLFNYINTVSLDSRMSATINQKYQAYLSVYEEVNCLMGKNERIECEQMVEDMAKPPQKKQVPKTLHMITRKPEQGNPNEKYERWLSLKLVKFGIKLRQVLQKHGYLYKQSDDPKDTILEG